MADRYEVRVDALQVLPCKRVKRRTPHCMKVHLKTSPLQARLVQTGACCRTLWRAHRPSCGRGLT